MLFTQEPSNLSLFFWLNKGANVTSSKETLEISDNDNCLHKIELAQNRSYSKNERSSG